MACGLGAVILILVLLKTGVPDNSEDLKLESGDSLSEQIIELQAESASLAETAKELKSSVEKSESSYKEAAERISSLKEELAQAIAKQKANEDLLQATVAQTASVPSEPTQIPKPKPKQPSLIGLKLTGSRIAILLDRSASMTEKDLVKILTRAAQGPASLSQGPKWQTAIASVNWLLEQVPEKSSVGILAFSEKSEWLGGGINPQTQLMSLSNEVERLYPEGGTNLASAINITLTARPDQIVIVTDGLPTVSAQMPLTTCAGARKNKVVTGRCRVQLFQAAVTSLLAARVPVSVILLPLEGDPEAAPLFSNLALSTGGSLLSPAPNWP